jgi:hypothetical protein
MGMPKTPVSGKPEIGFCSPADGRLRSHHSTSTCSPAQPEFPLLRPVSTRCRSAGALSARALDCDRPALEPGAGTRIVGANDGRDGRSPPMSATELEEFARDCVRLAEQADTLILREKLLNLAREWMRAAMDDEDARRSTGKEVARRKRPQPEVALPVSSQGDAAALEPRPGRRIASRRPAVANPGENACSTPFKRCRCSPSWRSLVRCCCWRR